MPAFILPPPLLAVDVNTVVGAIVFLVWVVSWLAKAIGRNNPPGPPVANRPRPAARPAEGKLQKEIDIFIQQMGGKKSPPRPTAPAARAPASKPPAQPQPAQRRPPRPPIDSKSASLPKPPTRERPGREIATRQAPGSGLLGTGMQQQLKQFGDKVTQEVTPHLEHRVEQHVEQHLGKIGPSTAVANPTAVSDHRTIEFLKNPANLRQAMVVNIVLSPPPALRHRRAT